MAIVTTDDKHYKAIADAIRSYDETLKLRPEDMADMVIFIKDASFMDGELKGSETGYELGYGIGKSDGIEQGYNSGIEDGKQAEYDRFWDEFQRKGTRTHYAFAFAYNGWTDTNYNPKYPIDYTNNNGISSMFVWNHEVTDTKVPITANGACANAFSNSGIKRIPKLIFRGATNVNNMFLNATKLEELYCEGEITLSISFAQSNLLTNESVQSIIDCLADLTGQTAQTLTLHADVGAKLTDAQKATITAKNWTLVY